MAADHTQVKVVVPGQYELVSLFGTRDELLALIEESFDSTILVRGNEITITGDAIETERVAHLFEELIELVGQGQVLTSDSVGKSIDMVRDGTRPSTVLTDSILTTRTKSIRPKTLGQKKYVDAIRKNTIVFSIGPAGTGKTYLAVAAAIKALGDREVRRIILTRPAVEAGERLGFLPGDVAAKVDPYLRPLYDALYEMLEPDAYQRAVERGTVEVAPLAFMRGRAQPLSSSVMTPEGWRALGGLEAGDEVIGSDGRPARVLGVYPQGRREVFRVTATDGASTICCGEHLWSVSTGSDRRRGKPPRVLTTREMKETLGTARRRQLELPLISAPVQFPARDTPLDPYTAGLLLGNGGFEGTAATSVSTHELELVNSLGASFPGNVTLHLPRSTEQCDGGRSGLGAATGADVKLRDIDRGGARSGAKLIPDHYLYNSVPVRLGLLQGLLDSSGGSVSRYRGTSRIGYSTTSLRLRDDVVFLVRSLGGVATCLARGAARRGGCERRSSFRYRESAYALDIRLPAWIAPFRLVRKAERHSSTESGRPRRFVTGIMPAGTEETICIEVAATDSLYVTDDLLLTHNTLNESFIILDEAQNTTPEQMKMFLTRLGFGSRAVITGDVTQIDLPSPGSSGLVLVQKILANIDGIAFSHLDAKDVVRHKIVQNIVEAYRRHGEKKPGRAGSSRRK